MQAIQSPLSCLFILTLLPWSLAYAGTISKDDHKTRKTHIQESYHSDKSACNSRSGNAKDICVQEAEAKSADEVAKERCDDLSGSAKSTCTTVAQLKFGKN
jgi:hypothetical protein